MFDFLRIVISRVISKQTSEIYMTMSSDDFHKAIDAAFEEGRQLERSQIEHLHVGFGIKPMGSSTTDVVRQNEVFCDLRIHFKSREDELIYRLGRQPK